MSFNGKIMTEEIRCPSEEECYSILRAYGTPEHVIGHCEAVCKTAVSVAAALNEHGYDLNIELIRAAALLHDIARVEENHHLVGGEYVESIGYPEVGEIVSKHMYHPITHDVKDVDEQDLVCLGDRLCKFDKYVGYEERMEYIKKKVNYREDLVKRINAGMPAMRKFLDDIADVIGQSVDELMGKTI
jgi:uncharacterized protein